MKNLIKTAAFLVALVLSLFLLVPVSPVAALVSVVSLGALLSAPATGYCMITLTNLNLPRLSNVMLQAFVKELLPLSTFSRNYSAAPSGINNGNVVLVPLIGTLTATTFGGTYAICGGTKSVVTVTINRHKIVTMGETDLDAANNSAASMEDFFYGAGSALGQAVVEDVLTLVTTANFAAVGTAVASTALDIPAFRSAKLALDQGNAPKLMRGSIIDVVGMDALLAVTNLVQAYMFKDQGVLQEGRVMRLLGTDLYTLNSSFPSAASINLFMCNPAAIATAMRYLEPQDGINYSMKKAISDPATGATFGMRVFGDEATGTKYIAFEANYGYSVGLSNAGRIVKRTD